MESSDNLGNQIPTELTVATANIASNSPRIHCITNEAATSLTANVLLALGAQPSMTSDPSDVTQFVEQSDALSINLGMLNDEKRGAIRHAVRTASNLEKPWILDPVMINVSEGRLNFCRNMLRYNPSAIRGNIREIEALETALDSRVEQISEKYSSIIVTSGETDRVVRSMSYKEVAAGHQWMAHITGMGCALSATIGAFISTSNDHLKATVDALTLWGIAAEHAHRASNGPGTFAGNFLDCLYRLSQESIS